MLRRLGSLRSSSCSSTVRTRPLLPPRERCSVVFAASKGFGSKRSSGKATERKQGGGSASGRGARPPSPPPPPTAPAGVGAAQLQQYDDLEAARKNAAEEAEFAQRLELIKADAAQKKAAGLVPSPPGTPGSASPVPGAKRAAFDPPPAEEEDIYANPPSLLSTLQDQLQSDINDPALRRASIGPGQLGLAAGAVLFGLVFVLVAGGDFATSNRYKGVRPSAPPPDPIEMTRLAAQVKGFEARLAEDPSDLKALEAAGVTYARMQDYEAAGRLLDKLTSARPDDAEAWRLLGETRLLSTDAAKSAAAYERAIALSPNDETIITGLVDAYIANSQQAKAVSFLTSLRDRIMSSAVTSSSSESSSSSSSSSGSSEGNDAARVVPVDPIGVQLLLGKSYAAWRGHDADALAAYDTLIGAFPKDFRGYLAKGVLLRERGRQGDAERMFLQAKYYAPEELQAFVAARAGERPDVAPLPDNGLE